MFKARIEKRKDGNIYICKGYFFFKEYWNIIFKCWMPLSYEENRFQFEFHDLAHANSFLNSMVSDIG
jgi:hypothetical protein